MTQLAAYEVNEGKRNVKIGNYFRSDYIAIQVLKSIVSASIAFAIVFALYVLYDFENFMQDLYKIDLIAFARDVLIRYGISVVAYGVITYIICTYRYSRVRRSLKRYYHNLKKLSSMYRE